MPIIGNQSYFAPSRFGSGAALSPMAADVGTGYVIKQDRPAGAVIPGVLGLGAVDLLDTVLSSVPGIAPFERGDINRGFLRAVDMPGLNDFWNDYQGGIEATSGIYGIVAAELATRKLTAPASAFMGVLSRVPYVRRIAALDRQYDEALQTVRLIDSNLASRGALGAEQYVGRAIVDTAKFDPITGGFISAAKELGRKDAVFAAKGLGFLKGAKNVAMTEATMAVTLNQNGFLYDDSAAHNLMWMAGGTVLGGMAEWLHGAYQIRKFVNSDEIRRTHANALDPGGQEEDRLLWHGKKLPEGVQSEGFLGGIFTDRATNLLVNARTLTDTVADNSTEAAMLEANRSRLATQHTALAREELQKATIKGISTDGRTRFSLDAAGFGNHVDMLSHDDPAWAYGVEQIGGVADDVNPGMLHDQHMKRLQERIEEADEELGAMLDDNGNLLPDADPARMDQLQRLARRLEYESELTPMAAIDGELMPLSEAEAFAGFKEPEIGFRPEERVKGTVKGEVPFTKQDNHGLWEIRSENPKGNISLGTDFLYHIPGNKKLAGANTDHYDVMRLYRLANRAIDQMSKFRGPLTLPKNADWFQLDMAEEVLRRTGGRAQVQFPDGMTRDTARIESLIQKAKAIKEWDKFELKKALKVESAGNTYEGQLSKLRLRFNLPRLTAYERGILGDQAEHPVESLLRGMAQIPEDELRKMTLPEIRSTMGRFKRVGDMAPVQSVDVEDLGTSFNFLKDSKGNPIKPLIVYKRPFKSNEWTTEHNAERLAAAKAFTSQRLTDEAAAPMTRAISASVLSNPDFDAAARTHELLDSQIQGSLRGAAPQTASGAFGKMFITSDWRDRDNPILLAATRIRESVNRMARDTMKAAIEGAFEGRLGLLANPRNASSKLLLNNFHSFRAGWDIAAKPHARSDGFFSFILRDTADNRERFLREHGREMGENQSLLAPNGKEVVLDELGMDIQTRFNKVTELVRSEKNTLLRSNSRSEIDHLDWYVPPGNLQGKYIGVTLGPDGKAVPGLGVVADTEEAFTKGRDEVLKKIEELGLGYTFRTQESIKEFANIWDRVQMDFINPGTTAVQPNKRQRGALAGVVLKTDAFEDSLKYLQDNFLAHSNDIVETLFREQINAAKGRAQISSELTKANMSRGYSAEARNVYDFYLENLLGKSKLNDKGSFVGRFYRSIEGPLDKFLAEETPGVSRAWQAGVSGVSRVWHATNEWVDKFTPWSNDEQAVKDFNALSEKLGKYMPFESATQMIERQGLGATPVTVQELTGKLNQFSAAVLLRIFEVAHPIMNLSGIVNASPAVIRSFQPRTGEAAEDFARRIGHAANIFDLGNGTRIGIPDMTKIAGRAFKRAWSRESHPDYDYMVRRGFLSQEVAEFQRQFGAIDSPGAWKTFFVGDPNKEGFSKKGLVGWSSILSDRSEDFSRSWGHMVGLEVADNLGIKGMEARHAFAHDVANKMIANYSPHNRPEIFQGALGAPIGLFQSFIINYYERLFRYVETKDYKSLVTQLASQAGLFGVTSLPGWQQFNSTFGRLSEGESDPESNIWRKFGGNAGDLIGHGVLSNIPKLFGGPAVDLFSRGDVSVRQLQIQDMDSISGVLNSTVPAINVVGKLYAGLIQGAKLFMGKNPGVSSQQVAEVMSNMIANRPLSGMIEQIGAQGQDTDRFGQLVTETQGGMETAYRLIGLRSMRQSEELRAFYANKNAMTHKAANDEQLRLYTRALLREGKTDEIPQVFEQYLKNGGDPRHFRRWLKMTYVAATSTRAERQLEKVMKDPAKMEQVLRLLDAGVSLDEDAKTSDSDLLYVAPDEQEPLTQDMGI